MAFGDKVASDSRAAGGGEWIRYFRDEETQIRIIPAEAVNRQGRTVYGTAAWPQEYEHFDISIPTSFPCTEEDDCIGCTSDSKEVRDKKRRIYFHALDAEGAPRIYRMGPQLYNRLKMKEQRALSKDPKNLQPLSDRDYIILRTGQKLNTEYDAEPGEAYEVDFPEELPDIAEALQSAYDDAVEASENFADEDLEEEEEPIRARTSKKRASPEPEEAPRKKKIARTKVVQDEDEEEEEAPAPRKRAAKKNEPAPEEESEGLGDNPTEEEMHGASTADLRDYLTRFEIEFPPRAPRRRLIEIALANPPF